MIQERFWKFYEYEYAQLQVTAEWLKKQRHLILSHNKSLEVDGSKISIVPKLYHKGLSLLLSFLYCAPQHAGFLSLCFFHLTGLSQLLQL